MKYFSNSINDDTYDDKINGGINDIRITLSRLGNALTKNNKKKIKKELDEIENKQNLTDNEKEEFYDYLVELVNALDKKEEYKYSDHDDWDYFGIRELENIFDDTDNDDNHYKPVLVKTSFKGGYKYYESRGGDKDKKLSVKQYLYMIMPYLNDLINDHKAFRNESNEWKIQLNMSINFISSNDSRDIRTFFVWSDNEEIGSVMKQMTLLIDFLNLS